MSTYNSPQDQEQARIERAYEQQNKRDKENRVCDLIARTDSNPVPSTTKVCTVCDGHKWLRTGDILDGTSVFDPCPHCLGTGVEPVECSCAEINISHCPVHGRPEKDLAERPVNNTQAEAGKAVAGKCGASGGSLSSEAPITLRPGEALSGQVIPDSTVAHVANEVSEGEASSGKTLGSLENGEIGGYASLGEVGIWDIIKEELKESEYRNDAMFRQAIAIEIQSQIDAATAPLKAENESLKARVEELEGHLPAEMQNCSIVFEECEKGHSNLRGMNWIKHPCFVCERDKFEAVAKQLVGALKKSNEAFLSDVEQPTKFSYERPYAGGYTDTIYHLDGAKCGNALNNNRAILAAYAKLNLK